jgi:hypothetical protein
MLVTRQTRPPIDLQRSFKLAKFTSDSDSRTLKQCNASTFKYDACDNAKGFRTDQLRL